MTAEKAIKILKVAKAEIEWSAPLEYQEALDEAIEALKKEVPQQPMKSIDTFSESLYKLYCPTCGNYIAYGNSRVGTLNKFTKDTDRCGYCGQKIDFER